MQLTQTLSRRWDRTASTLRRGFTMMEILVVLAILGLLFGLAVSNFDQIFGDARVNSTRLFVKESLTNPLFSYNVAMGGYPSTAEGLQALIQPPANKADRWAGPYLEPAKVPVDPWGEPYQYEYPGKRNKGKYDLWSKGPDKTTGTADDIGNWDAVAAPEVSK